MQLTVKLDLATEADVFTSRGGIIPNKCFLLANPNSLQVYGVYRTYDVMDVAFASSVHAAANEIALGIILKQFYKISVTPKAAYNDVIIDVVPARVKDFVSSDMSYTKPNVLYWMLRPNGLEGPFESMYRTEPERVEHATKLIMEQKLFILNSKQNIDLCEKQILKTAV